MRKITPVAIREVYRFMRAKLLSIGVSGFGNFDQSDKEIVASKDFSIIVPKHDLPEILKEWHRVLVDGGILIIECPDFNGAVKKYLEGNEERLNNIFGLQRFPADVHRFGYNFERLKILLGDAGFTAIEQKEPQDYHSKNEPCIRADCVKGN